MASPECLDDLKWLGFNLLNTATNHSKRIKLYRKSL